MADDRDEGVEMDDTEDETEVEGFEDVEDWLPGAEVEALRVSARKGAVEIDVAPPGGAGPLRTLALTGVDALWLEAFAPGLEVQVIGDALVFAQGAERDEDLEFALELLGLEDEKSPFAGGAKILYLEPEGQGDLHLAVRFRSLDVSETAG